MRNKKRKASALTEGELEVIAAMAEHNLRVVTVSKALYLHYNTVIHRIERVVEKTGKDPRKFYDLAELLGYVRADRKRMEEVLRKSLTGLIGAAISQQCVGQIAEALSAECRRESAGYDR